jgi:hypothetical protein
VALSLPDYNQVLCRLNGRLLPFGWLKALRARRRIDDIRVLALGVKREHRHTGLQPVRACPGPVQPSPSRSQ